MDTSALYALADAADPNHADARRIFSVLLEEEVAFTHNYVLVESIALIQRRIGTSAALQVAESATLFEIEWVDRNLHDSALQELKRGRRRQVSFVDEISFLLMRARNIEQAFSFDRGFVRQGFRQYGS